MKTLVNSSLVAVATLVLAGNCFADSVSPRNSVQSEPRTVALYAPVAGARCSKCAKNIVDQQVVNRESGHGQSIVLLSR